MQTFMKKSALPPDLGIGFEIEHSAHCALDLDLPDAPDFFSQRSTVPIDQILSWLDQYRQWFPQTHAQREQRMKRKCGVEFIL